MHRTLSRLAAALLVGTALLTTTASPASAHEDREVGDGGFQFTVGWADEPAYTGFVNSITLRVADGAGRPVTGATGLQVEVTAGEETAEYPLEAVSGTPGEYRAALVPTRPGTYTFRFTGTIRGDEIDEEFTSSDTTFDSPKDATAIAFPAKDPSAGQLAQRLARESARVKALQASLAGAEDDASQARLFAFAGIALAVLALAVGRLGSARRR